MAVAAHNQMTERANAAQLKLRVLAGWAEGFSIDPIVLAAGNAANPPGAPDHTAIAAGVPRLIDFGASFGGFHTDITRTFLGVHLLWLCSRKVTLICRHTPQL